MTEQPKLLNAESAPDIMPTEAKEEQVEYVNNVIYVDFQARCRI